MNFSKKHIQNAAAVADYLLHLSQEFRERWEKVQRQTALGYPFGDLAYGAALADWYEKGRNPPDATFSYAEGQTEDPFLIEFREELYQRFGLKILTIEEGKNRVYARITKVHDWGLN